MKKIELSVVIPAHNEEENVGELIEQLVAVLKEMKRSYEVVVVDDGSEDGTFAAVKKLGRKNKQLKGLRLRDRFGQTSALAAGFDVVQGEIVVTMDADLQNDPKDIPKLVKKLEGGYDVVSGWRKDRQDDYWTRVVPSVAANKLIGWISGVRLHDFGCGLKVLRRGVVEDMKLYGEMHRFIPAIAKSVGAKVGEMEVRHHRRTRGVSKYGMGRTVRVVLDVVTVKFLSSYRTRPLHLFGQVGLVFLGVGGGGFSWLVYLRLFRAQPLADRPLFLVAILLIIVGIQVISIGLLAEMMVRVYFESGDKKTYYVREVVN